MRPGIIPDEQIPAADPAEVVQQYSLWVKKLINRYRRLLEQTGAIGEDDLFQVGCMALLEAQKKYNPESGMTFLGYSQFYIRKAMRQELGFSSDGKPPAQLDYLDEPLSDEAETTRGDIIADPDALPLDEPIIAEETRRETSEQVRAALDRMKSDKQRTAVSLVWMKGKTREQAAAEMEMKTHSFYALEKYGRSTLRRDYRLRQYVMQMPSFHVGLKRFNQTFTSAVEAAVIWRDEYLPDYISRKEVAAEELDTGRQWTSAQHIAYMKRLKEKHQASKTDRIREIWNREHGC